MDVQRATIIGIGTVTALTMMTSRYEFILITSLALLPTFLMHRRKTLSNLHADKKAYAGIKITLHPVLIFFVLTLTHNYWLNYIS